MLKKIKKILFLLLLVISIVSLVACSIDSNIKTKEENTIEKTPSKTPTEPAVTIPEETPTIKPTTPEKEYDLISEAISGSIGKYNVSGTVVAVNLQSFVLTDETGSILVYKGSSWKHDLKVGDVISLIGTTSDYGKARQFSTDSTYEILSKAKVNYGSAKELNASLCDAYLSKDNVSVEYVKITGILSVSGNYYNLAFAGATIIGSISYPIDQEYLKSLNGKEIEVYGYVTGVTNNTYLNISATNISEKALSNPNGEPSEIETTIAKLITNKPKAEKEVIYVVTGTWMAKDGMSISSNIYGNGSLTDEYGNKIYLYGLSSNKEKCLSYSSKIYTYINSKDFPTLNILDGTIIRVGMVYNLDYNNYSAYLIEVVGDIPTEPALPDTSDKVNFFMINDTHGAFLDSSDSVSIGRVDTLIDTLTEKNGEYIKIHCGDALQGSYVSGQMYGWPIIESLNVMDFDCFVIGNHEFDWGLDKIAAYKDGNIDNGEATFPFLGANIYYKGTTTRPEWIDAYTIVEYEDIKVGIIGVMGPSQESSILTSYVKDYEFADPYNIVKTTADELRSSLGCSVVVVATHDYDESFNNSVASLSGDSRIDAIFCAHTHQLINESVTRYDGISIPVVQNYHKNNRATGVTINLVENNMISANVIQYNPEQYTISSDIQSLIIKYQDLITSANESLGVTSSYISKSTLGSYAVEVMLGYNYNESKFNGIDIAIMNTGGVRATITSGDITRADIFEVFPFNNKVVLVNMSGKKLKSLCAKNNSYFYIGVSDEYGSYANFKDNEIYQLAVIDYVFEDTWYTQFASLSKSDYLQTEIIMRDLIIDYIDDLY